MYSHILHCNLSFLPRAKDWQTWTAFLARKKAKCKDEDFLRNCLGDEDKHININSGHNVMKRICSVVHKKYANFQQKPDWNIITKNLPKLKDQLQIKEDLIQEAQNKLKIGGPIGISNDPVFVGVHVRRGDFGGYT